MLGLLLIHVPLQVWGEACAPPPKSGHLESCLPFPATYRPCSNESNLPAEVLFWRKIPASQGAISLK
ncbi:hypothetical protein Y1Q_0001634 [Alligator mississippiensis]|uniref:Uncharacterized protein n=1 Tax=Alligator mississippiensis TaxID=8496 RepID=A0A151MAB2_ALLMI|nr:hypothetical protein Y1Q_0001634 [Alligator mississippiensis]